MTTSPQSALTWQDDAIPVSTRFDDPYFSKNDGLSETRHVFLQGNDLPARLSPGFHVAELGFGTGLNLLALSLITTIPTRFTSFEAFPLASEDIARALDHFPEARRVAEPFLTAWAKGETKFQLGQITAEVILGDARETLAAWSGKADAWFLDGFSPAKNPELWSPEILTEVARHTAPGGTFATYTAAGHVRRALQDAGFAVTRLPGHGRKKHMSAGTLT
ncbi:MAG: tRNA (5-methylaminomethyl-2-thiouridine)(34)-methyltransferase MnmD [Cypionkella sp.]|nr:tRNA (5-methylaminomethyl-2-thiouridine)(34)-methyltransferase MnmD [Cypionkella sp.]MDZ4311399.1 tRNA (5-methylaminomethyl-2-thiouridine)(34)-methyltransferase MnmD [Cypionkella sp.]